MYDRAFSRSYSTEYTLKAKELVIHGKLAILAVTVQRIMNIDVTWKVSASGKVSVHMDVERNPEFPELPRFGLRPLSTRKYACASLLWTRTGRKLCRQEKGSFARHLSRRDL